MSTSVSTTTRLGFDIGTNPILQRRALPDERRIQGSDVYTWTHGKNLSKAGVDINRVKDYVDNLYDENGSYDDRHGAAVLRGLPARHDRARAAPAYQKQYYSFSQGFGVRSGEISTTDYAGFVSNDWRATPRLTLTTGLRYEYQYIPPNPYVNTTGISGPYQGSIFTLTSPVPQTADKPDDRNNIQPRVGFALDVFGTGKTYLRGGYGYYFGRIPNANILQVYLNSGSPNGQIRLSSVGGTSCTPQLTFPNIFPSGVAGALQFAEQCGQPQAVTVNGQTTYNGGLQTTVAYLDPHLQNPQVQEIDLAIEQNLGNQTVFLGQLPGFARPRVGFGGRPQPGSQRNDEHHLHCRQLAVHSQPGVSAAAAARRSQGSADRPGCAGDHPHLHPGARARAMWRAPGSTSCWTSKAT